MPNNMSLIKSKDTGIEIIFAKLFGRQGLGTEKTTKNCPASQI
jgi:G:T-mismatch repair DNA endonuclease (very short patch repair protein)